MTKFHSGQHLSEPSEALMSELLKDTYKVAEGLEKLNDALPQLARSAVADIQQAALTAVDNIATSNEKSHALMNERQQRYLTKHQKLSNQASNAANLIEKTAHSYGFGAALMGFLFGTSVGALLVLVILYFMGIF